LEAKNSTLSGSYINSRPGKLQQ